MRKPRLFVSGFLACASSAQKKAPPYPVRLIDVWRSTMRRQTALATAIPPSKTGWYQRGEKRTSESKAVPRTGLRSNGGPEGYFTVRRVSEKTRYDPVCRRSSVGRAAVS